MRLDQFVAEIISAPNFDHFSALEVRSAYLTLNSDKTIKPSDARRFVYSELVKLVKHGWLRKIVSKKKEITSFVKTELFDASMLVKLPTASPGATQNTSRVSAELKKRLNTYKNELLIGIGEIDEYEKLCEIFPELKEELLAKYENVREQNSKLLGSIKAIEELFD